MQVCDRELLHSGCLLYVMWFDVCCHKLNLVAQRDSCHSFNVDRAVATDLTSADSSTLHPPSDATSRARDPPHPVMVQHPVLSPLRNAPQTEPLLFCISHAHRMQDFLRVRLCLNLVSAPPSRPLAINSLMNSASPPVTVTQPSKFFFFGYMTERGKLFGHDNGPNSNFFLSGIVEHLRRMQLFLYCAASAKLFEQSLSTTCPRETSLGTMPQKTISDANSSISFEGSNTAHIVISTSCATCPGKASLGGKS